MSSPASSGPRRQARLDKVQRNFERRKVALGDCGRAYGTPLHPRAQLPALPACLRPTPPSGARLAEIRDNLTARIAEAEREGWLGEAEGLKISLAGADDKLAQIDRRTRTAAIDLGMPAPARQA